MQLLVQITLKRLLTNIVYTFDNMALYFECWINKNAKTHSFRLLFQRFCPLGVIVPDWLTDCFLLFCSNLLFQPNYERIRWI